MVGNMQRQIRVRSISYVRVWQHDVGVYLEYVKEIVVCVYYGALPSRAAHNRTCLTHVRRRKHFRLTQSAAPILSRSGTELRKSTSHPYRIRFSVRALLPKEMYAS